MNDDPVLYVIVCGAGPAGQVTRLISYARSRGWNPYLIATPAGLDFIDVPELESQTGHPVRAEYQTSGTAASGRSLPKADAIIVAPATYNTVNKWANGISDNFALGILAEAVGLHIPVVVLPFVNSALAAHPTFRRSVTLLRDTGIDVIHGPGRLEPHPPGTGASTFETFPWHQALDEADTLRHAHGQPDMAGLAEFAGLESLPTDVCLRLLESVPVGRVSFSMGGEVVTLPVNHAVDGQEVVFRTDRGSKLSASYRQDPVAFEADDYDPETRTGWSVLIKGRAEVIREDSEIQRLRQLDLYPWVTAAEHPFWIRIRPTSITGRHTPLTSSS
ncbi:MAG: pyridoxamine 5'-phosphate oxidase family protein [Streptosporangiaceae bacterium]|jgi:nitroimidazol reductase NimA-like FMN-containing flavoprotein (pyridoxamine 5'-phosphate oxidase superfamily)